MKRIDYVYDIETTKGCFLCVFININSPIDEIEAKLKEHHNKSILSVIKTYFPKIDYKYFIISKEYNHIVELYHFINNHTGYLIGFNNNNFDNVIINFLYKYTTYFYHNYYKRGDIIANACYIISQVIIIKDDYFKHGKYKSDIISDLVYQFESITHDMLLRSLATNYNQDWFKNYFLKDLREYNRPYISIDTMSLGLETVERKGLKAIAIILRWCRIKDMPHHHSSILTKEQIIDTLQYCTNDVLITLKYFKFIGEVLQSRFDIIAKEGIKDKYNIEKYLSANKAKLGDLFGEKLYAEWTGLKPEQFKNQHTTRNSINLSDVISKKVRFKTQPLIDLLKSVRDTIIFDSSLYDKDKSEKVLFEIHINKTTYRMQVGGLHSEDKPGAFYPTNDTTLKDFDFDSWYPNIVRQEKVEPAHLIPGIYYNMVGTIIDERTIAKKDPNRKTEAYQKKILLNSWVFGKLDFEGSWTKDRQAALSVTINGQLFLLMVIEAIEELGCTVISANTDGFTTIVPNNKLEEYYRITKYFQDYLSITGEYADYVLYVRKSVNDYIAITDKGKIKQKGSSFLTETDPTKSYGFPIRAKALIGYFRNKIPIEETILNNNDIYDFCLTQKMSETYTPYLYSSLNGIATKELQQKDIRYFVSNRGGILVKERVKDGKLEKQRIIKNGYITIFNDYYPKDTVKDYNVYYPYYIAETRKIIEAINKGIDIKDVQTSSNRFQKYTKKRKSSKKDYKDTNQLSLF